MLGKLEATANINTSGVGLGLSTCKKIAEALDGRIFLLEDEYQSTDNVDDSNIVFLENSFRTSNNLNKTLISQSVYKGNENIGTAIAVQVSCPELVHYYRKRD
jgi:signal transduction histidine kinase